MHNQRWFVALPLPVAVPLAPTATASATGTAGSGTGSASASGWQLPVSGKIVDELLMLTTREYPYTPTPHDQHIHS
jgi:hypothetical protein